MIARAQPRKDISKKELKRRLQDLLGHNQKLSLFASGLLKDVKKCHTAAAQLHGEMNLLISPMSKKARDVLGNICFVLGPYCVEQPKVEIKKGGEDGVPGKTDDKRPGPDTVPGSRRDGKDSPAQDDGKTA